MHVALFPWEEFKGRFLGLLVKAAHIVQLHLAVLHYQRGVALEHGLRRLAHRQQHLQMMGGSGTVGKRRRQRRRGMGLANAERAAAVRLTTRVCAAEKRVSPASMVRVMRGGSIPALSQ